MVWFVLLAATIGESPDDRLIPAWRSERYCGRNSLSAFLSLHSVPAGREAIDRLVPDPPEGPSIVDLQRAATALGLPSRVVRFDPARPGEWKGLLPAIVHLDSQRGHFVTLLRVDDKQAEYVELGAMQVLAMPAQAFLGAMSGYAVVRESPVRQLFFWSALGGSAGLALGLIVRSIRP